MAQIKRFLAIVIVAISVLFGGEAIGQTKITFTPQWTPQAQFAGYYVAKEMGFYEEAGLDVDIVHPTSSMYAIDRLNLGKSDIVTSMMIDAIVSRDAGVDIVNVMQLMPRSTMILISHIPINGDPEALRGKRVATWKAGFSTIVDAIFAEKGIEIEWVKFLTGVNIFLSKSVDATTAMTYNELQTIKETGYKIDDNYILNLWDLGYKIPEDGLYTTSKFAAENPETLRKFREASLKGWLWAAEHRDQTLDIVLEIAEKNHIPTNKYHQSKMLDNILESGVAANESVFELNKVDYEATRDLLRRADLIKQSPTYEEFVVGKDK